jgi:protein-L-isoaspartate O-methyltransferase
LILPEHIILAYQLMLGRSPESPEVIDDARLNIRSIEDLRQRMINSPEFMQRMSEHLDKPVNVRHRHPYTLPKIPVETEASPEQLAHMFSRIQQGWEALGESDPYWSVITQPQYHQHEFKQHEEQFYSSGKYIAEIFMAALRRHQINPADLGSLLEIGCGVGRVTQYLAAHFSRVIAADISAPHLAIAREYLASLGVHHVECRHCPQADVWSQMEPVDAILSVITLQHNPPPVMRWMLSTLLSKLNPGGIAWVQIPTYRTGYLFEIERYLSAPPQRQMEMHFLPQDTIFRAIYAAGCICLEVREDGMVGEEEKMLSNTFLIQKPSL